jgi:hypothetical protein
MTRGGLTILCEQCKRPGFALTAWNGEALRKGAEAIGWSFHGPEANSRGPVFVLCHSCRFSREATSETESRPAPTRRRPFYPEH